MSLTNERPQDRASARPAPQGGQGTRERPFVPCEIRFTLNGVQRRASVGADMSALQMLRDVIGLTGTKYGCGEGECGACTIIVDGRSVNSCLMFALDCDGRSVTTVEGLAGDARAQALAKAFVERGAVQCGFCTPGMMVQATHLLATNPKPDADAAKRAIEGNLCRCTGYQKIVEGIVEAGAVLEGAPARGLETATGSGVSRTPGAACQGGQALCEGGRR